MEVWVLRGGNLLDTEQKLSQQKQVSIPQGDLLAFFNMYWRKKHSASLLDELRLSETDAPLVYSFPQLKKQQES